MFFVGARRGASLGLDKFLVTRVCTSGVQTGRGEGITGNNNTATALQQQCVQCTVHRGTVRQQQQLLRAVSSQQHQQHVVVTDAPPCEIHIKVP